MDVSIRICTMGLNYTFFDESAEKQDYSG